MSLRSEVPEPQEKAAGGEFALLGAVSAPKRGAGDRERAARIMKRVHRDIAVKDLMAFGASRMWIGLLSLVASYFAIFERKRIEVLHAPAKDPNNKDA